MKIEFMRALRLVHFSYRYQHRSSARASTRMSTRASASLGRLRKSLASPPIPTPSLSQPPPPPPTAMANPSQPPPTCVIRARSHSGRKVVVQTSPPDLPQASPPSPPALFNHHSSFDPDNDPLAGV